MTSYHTRTQVRSLAGGLGQSLSAQVLPRVARRGAVGRGGVQHEVLGARGGDDPGGQEDVDDGLEEQEDLRLLEMGTVCRGKDTLGVTCVDNQT